MLSTGSFLFPPVDGRLSVLSLLYFSLSALGVHHRALRLEVDLCLLHFVRLRNAIEKERRCAQLRQDKLHVRGHQALCAARLHRNPRV